MIRLLLLLMVSSASWADCGVRELPPRFGGPAHSAIDASTLASWKAFRTARVEERMLEAWAPTQVYQRYKIEQRQIDAGCFTLEQMVDFGRALFLREFTLAEGLGGPSNNGRWYQRFQSSARPAAHATSCNNCHWKGGFAGAGDRVDNTFLDGDGDTQASHQQRNPPALIGLGWIELLAKEMTESLRAQRKALLQIARQRGRASTALNAKGVSFGQLSAKLVGDEVELDHSELEGVTEDMLVKPFGWEGRFATLPEMVEWSFATHLGMQSGAVKGQTAEVSEGQITALSIFLATMSSPVIEIPTVAGFRPDLFVPLAKPVAAPSFTQRWPRGQQLFAEMGCASCHRPMLELEADSYQVSGKEFSLHRVAATPKPEQLEGPVSRALASTERAASEPVSTNRSRVYLFSDLKRHNMGYGSFVTRPLWGLRNSAPYGFDGSANVIDQVLERHNHAASAARESASKYLSSHEKYKADLRVFLYSLMRAPQIRVR